MRRTSKLGELPPVPRSHPAYQRQNTTRGPPCGRPPVVRCWSCDSARPSRHQHGRSDRVDPQLASWVPIRARSQSSFQQGAAGGARTFRPEGPRAEVTTEDPGVAVKMHARIGIT